MTARKKCCKYCKHSTLFEDTWTYRCSLHQEDVKPMDKCKEYAYEIGFYFDLSNQIEDQEEQ